jgi:hypothetical protein
MTRIDAYKILDKKESIQNSNAAGKDKLLKMLDSVNPVIVRMKMKK